MTVPENEPAATSPTPLGRSAAHGVAWSAGATVASKVLGFVGQILLARLLTPDDFGVVGEAFTVAAFCSLVTRGAVRESLISRQRQGMKWQNDLFWMSALLGLGGGVLLALGGPLAAYFFQAPELLHMLLILALAAPFDGLASVPEATLTSRLRFGMLAGTAVGLYIVQIGMQVALAHYQCGGFSMILPLPLVSALRCIIYWFAARPEIQRHLNPARWRLLLSDLWVVAGAKFFDTIQGYADYLALALFHATATVGVYFFAYNLSVQVIVLLAANLSVVLFPVLSQLGDDGDRQVTAFIRAAQVLVAVAMPLCLIQAALAGPLIAFFFSHRWDASVLPLQILSVGTGLRLACGPATNLLQAQRRFGAIMWLSIATSLSLMLFVSVAAYFGGMAAVAVTESVCFFISHMVQLSLATGRKKAWWKLILDIYGLPMVLGSVATATALALVKAVAPVGQSHIATIAVVGVISGSLYMGLLRVLNPSLWRELVLSVKHLASKGRS
jgi:O-antigen/teichoic acid export membrane protein